MIENYQTVVLAAYKKLKETGEFTGDLSTRAKFRKECLRIFNKRYCSKDDDVFSEFFEVDKIGADFYLLLNRSDADDFKAVYNHIAGNNKTDNTEMKNTELLAWLIDFQPRPSTSYYKSLRKESEIDQPKGDAIQTGEEPEKCSEKVETSDTINPPDIPEDLKQHVSVKQILISCSIFILIGIGIYQFRENKSGKISSFSTLFSSGNEKCMYWTGDKYKPVSCDENLNGVSKIPINENKVWKFRRITQPDTLTKYALGKVWYAKKYGKIEFFTDSGAHPSDDNKRLLPVTTYIITKYASYDRYLLTMFYWFICIIVFSLLFGISAVYFGKSVKKRRNVNEKPIVS